MVIFKKSKMTCNKGSLMIEVIVVTSIVTIFLLGGLTVAQKCISVARQSMHKSEAAFLLEEGAEVTRILRDNGWSGVSALTTATDYYISFSGSSWSFSTTPSQVGVFTRKIVLSPVYRNSTTQDIASSGTLDAQTKLITVTVTWVEGTQTQTKTLQFYISDIFS